MHCSRGGGVLMLRCEERSSEPRSTQRDRALRRQGCVLRGPAEPDLGPAEGRTRGRAPQDEGQRGRPDEYAGESPMNRLGKATSPYLLQHKDNPVDWREWGPEAFAAAKGAGRPVLLSVGYAACHWCHVMAHESFEDDGVAAVMNELFVNIKVDREERPDVDHIYMSALHLLGEHGGWPLTMFLTPAGEPFWGGTYFPKEPKFGRPGFVQVLREIAHLYHGEPERIAHNRRLLIERLEAGRGEVAGRDLGLADLD